MNNSNNSSTLLAVALLTALLIIAWFAYKAYVIARISSEADQTAKYNLRSLLAAGIFGGHQNDAYKVVANPYRNDKVAGAFAGTM